MLRESGSWKAAKKHAQRTGRERLWREDPTEYARRLVRAGLMVEQKDVHGCMKGWAVAEETDWWAVVAGRHRKAGPCATRREVVEALHADTVSRVPSGTPGERWVDGLYKVDGREDVFAVRHDVAVAKGWVTSADEALATNGRQKGGGR